MSKSASKLTGGVALVLAVILSGCGKSPQQTTASEPAKAVSCGFDEFDLGEQSGTIGSWDYYIRPKSVNANGDLMKSPLIALCAHGAVSSGQAGRTSTADELNKFARYPQKELELRIVYDDPTKLSYIAVQSPPLYLNDDPINSIDTYNSSDRNDLVDGNDAQVANDKAIEDAGYRLEAQVSVQISVNGSVVGGTAPCIQPRIYTGPYLRRTISAKEEMVPWFVQAQVFHFGDSGKYGCSGRKIGVSNSDLTLSPAEKATQINLVKQIENDDQLNISILNKNEAVVIAIVPTQGLSAVRTRVFDMASKLAVYKTQ